jgi:uncharacterized delta-60 repeat protein
MFQRFFAHTGVVLLSVIVFLSRADATVAQPGTLDQTWAPLGSPGAGRVTTPVGTLDDFGRALVMQADGKALVAGECVVGTSNQFCVVRYNTDGTLDTTWNGTGKVFSAMGSASASAMAIGLQAEGRVVVAGTCVSATLGRSVFCAARFNNDGSPDIGWNGVGYATTSIGLRSDAVGALVAQGDGKVVLAGDCNVEFGRSDVCLIRYAADGTLDLSWGDSGKTQTRVPGDLGIVKSAVLQSDGGVLVTGYCGSSTPHMCVLRYDSTGTLDTNWGNLGTVVLNIANNSSAANVIFLQADNQIVVAGYCFNGTINGSCAVRLNGDGSFDTSWNGTGQVIRPAPSGESFNAIAQQPDGKLIIAGGCSNGFANAFCASRFQLNGTLDLSWGDNGKATTAFTRGDGATGVAIGSDFRVLLTGYCNGGFNANFCALRYDGGLTPNHACSLDVDGDGLLLATKDALLLNRAMLGAIDFAVTGNIEFSPSASRTTWPDIRDHLAVSAPDLDGDGRVTAATDALMLTRVALGFTGDAVINDIAFAANAQRTTWTSIKSYLFTPCGAGAFLQE